MKPLVYTPCDICWEIPGHPWVYPECNILNNNNNNVSQKFILFFAVK